MSGLKIDAGYLPSNLSHPRFYWGGNTWSNMRLLLPCVENEVNETWYMQVPSEFILKTVVKKILFWTFTVTLNNYAFVIVDNKFLFSAIQMLIVCRNFIFRTITVGWFKLFWFPVSSCWKFSKTENVNLGQFIFKDSTGRWNIVKCTPDAKGKTFNNNNNYYYYC